MKLALMLTALVFSSSAMAVDVIVPVSSKTGNKYDLQIMVPGAKEEESAKMTEIILKVVPLVASEYSTVWLLDHRSIIMDRLEKEFKQAKLFSDGVGVLRLRRQGNKILDVE